MTFLMTHEYAMLLVCVNVRTLPHCYCFIFNNLFNKVLLLVDEYLKLIHSDVFSSSFM